MKVLSSIAISIIASGVMFAADFSTKSIDDLVNMAGKVSTTDMKDYVNEIEKRTNEMTVKEAKAFKEKLKTAEEKAFENMKVKDVKAYKQSMHENMKANVQNMKDNFPCFDGKKGKKGGDCPLNKAQKK